MSTMWYACVVLALTRLALGQEGVATTARPPPRAPARTLDRQAAELAWRSWLQSPESGNQNAPPRRITTKSLFLTPIVCLETTGQRLDREGCVQVVTVNKDEHERILLEQLNARYTPEPSGGSDVVYDYGDSEPLQLSIPIGLEPQAAPLQSGLQGPQSQENYVNFDKKDKDKLDKASTIEAELENLKHLQAELSKLQQYNLSSNGETGPDKHISSPTVHNSLLPHPDKPKRDSSLAIPMTTTDLPDYDEGQKEVVFGHVNFDPYLNQQVYDSTETTNTETYDATTYEDITPSESNIQTTTKTENNKTIENEKQFNTDKFNLQNTEKITNESKIDNKEIHELKKDVDKTQLNPEIEYSDIGKAIKLISRYAEVTTDDSYSKDHKRYASKDEGILGTRTKLQHRRNKLKPEVMDSPVPMHLKSEIDITGKLSSHSFYPKSDAYYRYPWVAQQSPTPPPDYPFRHLQDYWPGKKQVGGLYNFPRENPRRHHHSFSNNYYRNHVGYYAPPMLAQLAYPGSYVSSQDLYPPHAHPPHRIVQQQGDPSRLYNNQDLYSLLGLRHWFSSEGSAKR